MKRKLTLTSLIGIIALLSIYYFGFSQDALKRKMYRTQDMKKFQKCCMKIKDQTVLFDFVKKDCPWGKRRIALDYIIDPSLLKKVIEETSKEDNDIIEVANARLEHIQSGRPASELQPTIRVHTISSDGKID